MGKTVLFPKTTQVFASVILFLLILFHPTTRTKEAQLTMKTTSSMTSQAPPPGQKAVDTTSKSLLASRKSTASKASKMPLHPVFMPPTTTKTKTTTTGAKTRAAKAKDKSKEAISGKMTQSKASLPLKTAKNDAHDVKTKSSTNQPIEAEEEPPAARSAQQQADDASHESMVALIAEMTSNQEEIERYEAAQKNKRADPTPRVSLQPTPGTPSKEARGSG